MMISPEIFTLFLLNILFAFFGFIAFVFSIKIVLKWDGNSSTELQYKLEKESFLAATIIKYIFLLKVVLFLFFIFTLDKISSLLSGAMCAAGVVDATAYGVYLILLKLLNLYLFAYWLVLDKEDVKLEEQPYTKLKFRVFTGAFFLLIAEIILESMMFYAIDIKKVVDCCGVIYSSSASSYMSALFRMDATWLLIAFYGNFLLLLLAYTFRKKELFTLFNALFIIVALITLIAFFGTYIYELPTHHCPFCFLQKEYYYVGYLLYISLFIGTFYGLIVSIVKTSAEDLQRNYKVSLFFTSLYVVVVTLYPIYYYSKNGLWL